MVDFITLNKQIMSRYVCKNRGKNYELRIKSEIRGSGCGVRSAECGDGIVVIKQHYNKLKYP